MLWTRESDYAYERGIYLALGRPCSVEAPLATTRGPRVVEHYGPDSYTRYLDFSQVPDGAGIVIIPAGPRGTLGNHTNRPEIWGTVQAVEVDWGYLAVFGTVPGRWGSLYPACTGRVSWRTWNSRTEGDEGYAQFLATEWEAHPLQYEYARDAAGEARARVEIAARVASWEK